MNFTNTRTELLHVFTTDLPRACAFAFEYPAHFPPIFSVHFLFLHNHNHLTIFLAYKQASSDTINLQGKACFASFSNRTFLWPVVP